MLTNRLLLPSFTTSFSRCEIPSSQHCFHYCFIRTIATLVLLGSGVWSAYVSSLSLVSAVDLYVLQILHVDPTRTGAPNSSIYLKLVRFYSAGMVTRFVRGCYRYEKPLLFVLHVDNNVFDDKWNKAQAIQCCN